MPLTNDDLSLWELAHRLASSDPYKRYWFGLPQYVKDNVRLLVNEIIEGRLTSSLIMDKRHPDSDLPPEYFVREHLDSIDSCVSGNAFPRRFLRFVWVNQWDFWDWCQRSNYHPPDFWFSVVPTWPTDELPEDMPADSKQDRPASKREELRQECRSLARQHWKEEPEAKIAQLAARIQELGVATHFQTKTVVTWIRSEAPESVRGRPGRPKKNGT